MNSMTDLETAIRHLEGHSVCLCRNGEIIARDGRGIAPVMQLLAEQTDLRGFSAADLIVGKAAAMLFVKAGVVSVHGKTMSENGKAYLTAHGIPCTCDVLTEKIINRKGDGICPMEQTVLEIDDPEAGYAALRQKIAALAAASKQS